MTEAEWLTSTKPEDLLVEIGNHRPTYRKCRLLLCGYCRRFFWQAMPPRFRAAVEASERYADGASKYQLQKAREGTWGIPFNTRPTAVSHAATAAQSAASPSDPYRSACELFSFPSQMFGRRERHLGGPRRGQRKLVAELLREIFGNPFRLVASDPSWLTWNNGTVVKLAQTIYDERSFGDLPILADALEEAGCSDVEILQHCRQPGEHVRGCWVVDSLLDLG